MPRAPKPEKSGKSRSPRGSPKGSPKGSLKESPKGSPKESLKGSPRAAPAAPQAVPLNTSLNPERLACRDAESYKNVIQELLEYELDHGGSYFMESVLDGRGLAVYLPAVPAALRKRLYELAGDQ